MTLKLFILLKTLAESLIKLLKVLKPLYPLLSISATLLNFNFIASGISIKIYIILDFA
jgi:hypothetical protein